MKRRAFLKQFTGLGVCAATSGCLSSTWKQGEYLQHEGKSMADFRAPALERIRVGVVGVGNRGMAAVSRLSQVPGVEIRALCDVRQERVEKAAALLEKRKCARPALFSGSEEIWKRLCERNDLDLVYICTPWLCHTPMAVFAMESGKHAAVEVPAAVSVEECWQLVNTSERTRKHCMMLENCCYGENELFALMLCRKGILGELVHGEAAYIHDLRKSKLSRGLDERERHWRLDWSMQHTGNPYPTHGLGPICSYMNINRGDRMVSLTSLSSDAFGLKREAEKMFGEKSAAVKFAQGDMNNTIIRTYRGRTILVQHDTTSPRPYSRLNLISGTKGVLSDYPLRVALLPNAHSWLSDVQLAELKKKYQHPLWKFMGERARKQGGHGGMDFLMDYRLAYCLTHGLALDMNVYDAASLSCLVELTETSVVKGGAPVDIPDFTRSGWKTTAEGEWGIRS